MISLYNQFPREVAFPGRKTVYSLNEFLNEINKYNGIKPVYASVYCFPRVTNHKPDYESAILDKVFFDFDGASAYHDACVLHEHLSSNNYKHIFVFSGRGYHIYLKTKGHESLKSKKGTLLETHNHFERLLEITIDEKIKGDLARVSRVLNSWNTKGERYCIFISDEDLNKGEEWIKEKAKKQQLEIKQIPWFGKNLYDLSQHDNGSYTSNLELLEIDEEMKRKINSDDLLKELPKCVSSIMTREKFGWKGRYMVIVYLHEYGYTRSEIIEVLKKYMKPKEFDHMINSEKQVDYLIRQLRNNRLQFSSCSSIRQQGGCPFKWDCSKSRMLYK